RGPHFNPGTRTPGRPQRLKAEPRGSKAVDGPRALRDEIVNIFAVAADARGLVGPVVALERGRGAAPLLQRGLLGQRLVAQGFAQAGLSRRSLWWRRQQQIHALALFVPSALSVSPFPVNFHLGFLSPPAPSHGTLAATALLVKLQGLLADPGSQ